MSPAAPPERSPVAPPERAIWHDVECGSYAADLPSWRQLAAEAAGPVLELGAGTGRVALALARAGIEITALERDPVLLGELERRAAAERLAVSAVRGDARELALEQRFALIIAPMQLMQLLGGRPGRAALLRGVAAHLRPAGRLAAALLAGEVATGELRGALPDLREVAGRVYSSLPLAVESSGGGLAVRRLRQVVTPSGELRESIDLTRLDPLSPAALEAEALAAGLRPAERLEIAATDDHVGSTIVVLEAG